MAAAVKRISCSTLDSNTRTNCVQGGTHQASNTMAPLAPTSVSAVLHGAFSVLPEEGLSCILTEVRSAARALPLAQLGPWKLRLRISHPCRVLCTARLRRASPSVSKRPKSGTWSRQVPPSMAFAPAPPILLRARAGARLRHRHQRHQAVLHAGPVHQGCGDHQQAAGGRHAGR